MNIDTTRLKKHALFIASQWDGDHRGKQEDRATAALDLEKALIQVEELCEELEIK